MAGKLNWKTNHDRFAFLENKMLWFWLPIIFETFVVKLLILPHIGRLSFTIFAQINYLTSGAPIRAF